MFDNIKKSINKLHNKIDSDSNDSFIKESTIKHTLKNIAEAKITSDKLDKQLDTTQLDKMDDIGNQMENLMK